MTAKSETPTQPDISDGGVSERLKSLDAAATQGTWGQFHIHTGPFKDEAREEFKRTRTTNLDTSHHMSALVGRKPKRLSVWTHADDAAFAETLVNAYRSGELVLAAGQGREHERNLKGNSDGNCLE